MKLLIVTLLVVFLLDYGVHSATLEQKETEGEPGQQRSSRVHRVSNFEDPDNDESRVAKFLRDLVSSQATIMTNQNFVEFLKDFPNTYALVQQEAQLFLELNVILNELIQDGTVSLRSMELAISEMMETTSIEPTPISDDDSRNLSNPLQKPDGRLQSSEEDGDRSNSRGAQSQIETMSEAELNAVANIARSLDYVMKKIQNHIIFVRSVFEKLCRKRQSPYMAQSSASNPEKFALMSQPNEVPVLQT